MNFFMVTRDYFRTQWIKSLLVIFVASFWITSSPAANDGDAKSTPAKNSVDPNDLLSGAGTMEAGADDNNPWAGVDGSGFLKTFGGKGLVVTNQGKLTETAFSSSPCVGDLDGDGLVDIVAADAKGFIWYYRNSGTKQAPAFTRGELLPLFFSTPTGASSCLKLDLVDFNGDGRLDLVLGDLFGNVYLCANEGSKTAPLFRQFRAGNEVLLVPTDPKSIPWGNFLSPCVYDWNGDGVLDLILGEGTYTANRIYLYTNAGSGLSPRFTESKRTVLIAGMGREHLTPKVVDWNGDDKPDILMGEREGYVNLYINETSHPPEWKFQEPVRLSFGGKDKIGGLSNFAVADLNGDGKFDFIMGETSGRVAVTYNQGTKVAPTFGAPVELTGVNPFLKIRKPAKWGMGASDGGAQFYIARLVGVDEREPVTFEKGLQMLPETPGKYALKAEVFDPGQKFFPTPYLIPEPAYSLGCSAQVNCEPGVEYEFSCLVKGDGFQSAKAKFEGEDRVTKKDGEEVVYDSESYGMRCDIPFGTSWGRVTQRLSYQKDRKARNPTAPVSFSFSIKLLGKGVFYLDDVKLTKVER